MHTQTLISIRDRVTRLTAREDLRAFVKDPALLILDEPLHGLDTYNRALVKDVIQTFCAHKDKTLIMVTHYAHELPDCIGHRLFLKKQQ